LGNKEAVVDMVVELALGEVVEGKCNVFNSTEMLVHLTTSQIRWRLRRSRRWRIWWKRVMIYNRHFEILPDNL
jgi:hypothetical protein